MAGFYIDKGEAVGSSTLLLFAQSQCHNGRGHLLSLGEMMEICYDQLLEGRQFRRGLR